MVNRASGMVTDSFINIVQSFITRRGKSNTIVSDCGSNFKGAFEELKLEAIVVSSKLRYRVYRTAEPLTEI